MKNKLVRINNVHSCLQVKQIQQLPLEHIPYQPCRNTVEEKVKMKDGCRRGVTEGRQPIKFKVNDSFYWDTKQRIRKQLENMRKYKRN
jgi:hypothetical protein